jgi:hypothetical protein
MLKGTTLASPVTPAAEPLSSDLTMAIVKEALRGLSIYAKKDRMVRSEPARKKVGAKGIAI